MQFLLINDKSRDLCGVRFVFRPKVLYVDNICPLLLKNGEPTCVLFNETTKQIAVIYYFKNYLHYTNPISLIHINLLRQFCVNIYRRISHAKILDSDQKSFTGRNIEVNSHYDLNKLYAIEDINNNEFEFIPITDKDILNIKHVFRIQQNIKIEAYKFLYNKVYKNSDPKYSNKKLVHTMFLTDLINYLYNRYDCDNQRKRSILRDCINLICLNINGIKIHKYKSTQIFQFESFNWNFFKQDYVKFCLKYGGNSNDLNRAKIMYDNLCKFV